MTAGRRGPESQSFEKELRPRACRRCMVAKPLKTRGGVRLSGRGTWPSAEESKGTAGGTRVPVLGC